MRVLVSRILFAAGVLALVVCLLLGAAVIRSHPHALARDDLAGISLGIHFLLYILLPLTFALLLGGAMVNPPTRHMQRLGIRRSAAPGYRTTVTAALAALSLVGAAVITLGAVHFLGASLVSAARHYGYKPCRLGVILLQNVVLSAPLLTLGGLLAWAGRILGRPV